MSNDTNPVINKSGTATFNTGNYCLVNTVQGSMSSFQIQNTASNVLTVVVSGAPPTVQCNISGVVSTFNGSHQLNPNQQSITITALDDFLGQQVRIINQSTAATTCKVTVSASQ